MLRHLHPCSCQRNSLMVHLFLMCNPLLSGQFHLATCLIHAALMNFWSSRPGLTRAFDQWWGIHASASDAQAQCAMWGVMSSLLMSAGIVQGTAKVSNITEREGFRRLRISFPSGATAGVQIGASVALNGTCLTVGPFSQQAAWDDR